jgi:phosphoribosylformimino-5-aminoimidazole carboxamide ribotide isomerase
MDKESVDTLRIFDELSPTLGEESARKLATLLGSMYVELRDVVRREDFTDLHGLVSDLAETQRGTEASVKQLLDLGVKRVIIGTKAVQDFEWFSEMTRKFSGQIALGLDAKGSKVATHGWTQDSSQTILEFATEAAKLPLAAIIYTDIAKDGMMSGPNFERTRTLVEAVNIPVVASGGVNTVEDIRKLAEFNPAAAIIGRSLYEGTLNLTDAIEAARA